MKKLLSLTLALSLLLSLCLPTALAAGKPTREDFENSYTLDVDSTDVECAPFSLERMDIDENRHLPASDSESTSFNAIEPSAKFTVKNTGKGEDFELSVLVMPYSLYDGKYSQDVEPGGYRLRQNYFQLQMDGSEAGGKPIVLKSGQSFTFDLTFKDAFANAPHKAAETNELIYAMSIIGYNAEYDWNYWANYIFMVGDEDPQATKSGLAIQFDDDYYMSDIGPINDLTITNNTTEPITGAYTLLLYYPKMYCLACSSGLKQLSHTDNPSADIYSFDLNLAPGVSITKTEYFGSERNLTGTKFVWVEYDDAAERDAYLNDSALFRTNTVDFAASIDNYVGYWIIQDAAYLARYPYEITLEPVNHKK